MVTKTIFAESTLLNELQRILKEGKLVEDTKDAVCIHIYSACFNENDREAPPIEADIKIVNGDPPYIDAVLFDGGHEVRVLDVPDDDLTQPFDFEYNGEVYRVIINEVTVTKPDDINNICIGDFRLDVFINDEGNLGISVYPPAIRDPKGDKDSDGVRDIFVDKDGNVSGDIS